MQDLNLYAIRKLDNFYLEISHLGKCLVVEQSGRVENWRSGLGLAYPHFHEDVSVSSLFV